MAGKVSVGEPIGWALSRTTEVLFRPFRLGKWFILALPAGLTLLFEGGVNFNFNTSGGRGGPGGPPSPAEMMRDAVEWIRGHYDLVAALAVAGLVVLVALWIVCRWLNCRGRFMFFDALVNNDARIAEPWSSNRELANSLWVVRLAWDMIRWVILGGVLALLLILFLPDLRQYYESGNYKFTAASATGLIVGVPLWLAVVLVFWVLNAILFHLAIPTMYIRRMKALPAIGVAWRELLVRHWGASLLYFLFLLVVQIVWVIWLVIALGITCCVTLCIGLILAVIPLAGSYVLALITLPVLAFKSAYRLYFVSQFGDDYRIVWQVSPQGGFPVTPDEPNPYALQ